MCGYELTVIGLIVNAFGE